MIVIAHRANWEGGDSALENTLGAVRYCLERGWGIETDIRRGADGRFYLAHDPVVVSEENEADPFFALFREHPNSTIALNVKECGYEEDLISYLSEQRIPRQVFLFDMELFEETPGQTARLFRTLDPETRLAARVSDRGEPIPRALKIPEADIIWLDEFDGPWATEDDIIALKSFGKTVYAVSPEIHGFSSGEMHRRWKDFFRWGVDGICTDHANLLSDELTSSFGSSK